MARRVKLFLRIAAMPTAALVWMVHTIRTSRNALRVHLRCKHCSSTIQLVRAWRCSCGHTFVGSYLRACGICGGRPLIVRCHECGITQRVR